jgi:SAM-dependent methyltransferase
VSSGAFPLPPFDLATRVGSLDNTANPWELYEAIGRASRDDLLAALPVGFSLEGRRILDFGCGAGRTLRHFIEAGSPGEFWGCDIDAASVAWLRDTLSPPLHPFVNGELPPLAQPDEMFDLIYCVSVFTHLSRSWSAWLIELHRVLRPEGLMLVTFMGEGESQTIAGEEWNEDAVGMLTLRSGQPWSNGGPMILHSPWWIREHWGRLFDIVSLSPYGFPARGSGTGHGLVVMRKKEVNLTPIELEALSDDPREAESLARNINHLVRELETLRHATEIDA